MNYILDAATMKAVDAFSINEMGIPSVVLMERAALGVTSEILNDIYVRKASDVKVLCICGSGNNGADGLAVARQLNESGIAVDIMAVGSGRQTKEYGIQRDICNNLGLHFLNSADYSEYNYIVDAIFGIGLSREIAGEHADIINGINDAANTGRTHVFAVDIPSGINAGNGRIMGCAVKAYVTVTFGYNKLGMMLYPAADYCGRIVVKDIGFAPADLSAIPTLDRVITYTGEDLCRMPLRRNYSNKGTYGKALVVAGSKSIGGAAILCTGSAFACGTGLVKVYTHEDNRTPLLYAVPESLISVYDKYDENALSESLSWADCAVIGPGISMDDTASRITGYCCEYTEITRIFDADALNIIARDSLTIKKGNADVFVTPHLAEMARLMNLSVSDIREDLIGAATGFSKMHSCICILKDTRTIVADGDRIYINSSGNDGMATGGSGDVLAGVLAGLCATGLKGFEAACMAVYIHGLAGDDAAVRLGKRVMTAGDITDSLCGILKMI